MDGKCRSVSDQRRCIFAFCGALCNNQARLVACTGGKPRTAPSLATRTYIEPVIARKLHAHKRHKYPSGQNARAQISAGIEMQCIAHHAAATHVAKGDIRGEPYDKQADGEQKVNQRDQCRLYEEET